MAHQRMCARDGQKPARRRSSGRWTHGVQGRVGPPRVQAVSVCCSRGTQAQSAFMHGCVMNRCLSHAAPSRIAEAACSCAWIILARDGARASVAHRVTGARFARVTSPARAVLLDPPRCSRAGGRPSRRDDRVLRRFCPVRLGRRSPARRSGGPGCRRRSPLGCSRRCRRQRRPRRGRPTAPEARP